MKVWMLDPAAMSPHYNLSLIKALRAQGTDAQLLTSRFLHEDHVPLAEQYAQHIFFRPLEKWKTALHQRAWGRQIGRVVVYPLGLQKLWHMFRRNPPDILHVQWIFIPTLDRHIIRHLARSVPLVLTVHNPLLRHPHPTRQGDLRSLYSTASRVIVHTNQNRDILLKDARIDPQQVAVIPHGPLFEGHTIPNRAQARAELQLTAEAQVILFFGLIKPYKGLIDLIMALSLLRKTVPNAHLLIAGKPHGSIEPYLQAIARHNLETATTLHTRFIPSSDVPKYFAASNVVCLPYHEASQSGVLMSAYHFGRPVIVTSVGGLPESIEEDRNGYVVPPSDPKALASALSKVLTNATLQEAFGARSLELAQTRFSWSYAASLTQTVYEQAIATSTTTSR